MGAARWPRTVAAAHGDALGARSVFLRHVFEVLTNTEAWQTWSTMLRFHGGHLALGQRVKLGLRTEAAQYDFEALVTELEVGERFEWFAITGIRGVFDGRHRFELTPLPGGRTRRRNINEALRQRAEAG